MPAPVALDHEVLVGAWLRDLESAAAAGQRAAETVETYRRLIRPWLAFLREHEPAGKPPTPATVQRYLVALRPGRKPATLNAHLAAVRSCYAWAESKDAYPAIARSVRSAREHRDGPLPSLTPDEVNEFLRAVSDRSQQPAPRTDLEAVLDRIGILRDIAFVRVLYGTGLRLVSLVRADAVDVDLRAAPPVLRHQPKGHQAKDALAVLPSAAAVAVAAYLVARTAAGVAGDALWVGLRPRPGSRLTDVSMRRIVTAGMARAGFARRDGSGNLVAPGQFSAHCIRRSAVTAVVDAQGLEAGQILAGHASADTTRKAYARAKRFEVLRGAANMLDLPS